MDVEGTAVGNLEDAVCRDLEDAALVDVEDAAVANCDLAFGLNEEFQAVAVEVEGAAALNEELAYEFNRYEAFIVDIEGAAVGNLEDACTIDTYAAGDVGDTLDLELGGVLDGDDAAIVNVEMATWCNDYAAWALAAKEVWIAYDDIAAVDVEGAADIKIDNSMLVKCEVVGGAN